MAFCLSKTCEPCDISQNIGQKREVNVNAQADKTDCDFVHKIYH